MSMSIDISWNVRRTVDVYFLIVLGAKRGVASGFACWNIQATKKQMVPWPMFTVGLVCDSAANCVHAAHEADCAFAVLLLVALLSNPSKTALSCGAARAMGWLARTERTGWWPRTRPPGRVTACQLVCCHALRC